MQSDWVLVSDFDGIFTTSHFSYTAEGKVMKHFSPNDAHILQLIRPYLKDFQILTGETSSEGLIVTKKRLSDINLSDCLNVVNSQQKLQWLKDRYDLKKVAYFGDDVYDSPIFQTCGFSACPSTALDFVQHFASYVSKHAGGQDAFADMLDKFAYQMLQLDVQQLIQDQLTHG